MRRWLLHVPNGLTLSRLLAIPVLWVILAARFNNHDQLAAGIFLLASLTDIADGAMARRLGLVSELGKFLDPLADKLFVLSVLLALVQEGLIPAWVVVVIFGRELLITILRSVSAGQGRVIAATPFGKTKTVTQVASVALLILSRPYPAVQWPAWVVLGFAVVFTLWSGADYLWRFRHVLTRGAAPPAAARGGAPSGGSGVDPLAAAVGERLARLGLTLAVAESCTGGLLGSVITEQPGSSAYFAGGVIAYSNRIKAEQLRVPPELIERHGAVSSEVARAMAEGARRLLGADLGLAVTGISGPGGGTAGKPVGLTYVWLATARGSEGRRHAFDSDRSGNRRRAVTEAMRLLLAVAERTTTEQE